MMSPKRFNKIAQEVYSGYTGAFDEVYLSFYERMKMNAFFPLKNEADASDAASNALTNILANMKVTENFNVDNPGAYLNKTLHNAVIDIFKNRKKSVPLENVTELADDSGYDSDAVCTNVDVYAAFGKIKNPDNRKIAIMFFIMDIDQKQIASEVNMPVGTVKTRVRAIKAEIAKYLK